MERSAASIDFPRIATLFADGHLPLDLLVTERIGLEGVVGALDACGAGMALDGWSCTDASWHARCGEIGA